MHVKQKFLKYFEKHNHKIIKSYPLTPQNDPSLLFINSGMAPMKRFFANIESAPSPRVANAQKCVRAGGKHNDLNEVGYTKRHHTFFEMLGSFSFGDYFKQEAITLTWNFLTQELNIPTNKLIVTVHPDDQESREIWESIPGVTNIMQLSENEWSAGDEGPCGVCTEIFYDHGPTLQGDIHSGDRFVEIWNLVFMTHTVSNGIKTALPKPCVDTGMGLERIEAVCHGTHDNYEAPMFKNMINLIESQTENYIDRRIIADHARAIVFMVDDNIYPTSEGQGYVLRKIIRRAVIRALNNDSVEKCMQYVIDSMSDEYPSLIQSSDRIFKTFLEEKSQFVQIYNQGIDKLQDYIKHNNVNEQKIFELYDTYGFPIDISLEILKQHNKQCNVAKIDEIVEKNRASSKLQKYHIDSSNNTTEFTGYNETYTEANIISYKTENDLEFILLDKTPFYVEAGGQKNDLGTIQTPTGKFEVHDLQKNNQEIWHIGQTINGTISVGPANVQIDESRRKQLTQHHSATHILLAVLRNQFGDSVTQKGSSVKPDSLRLDFAMANLITEDELKNIIYKVNEIIQSNLDITTTVTSYEKALEQGALITEKSYPQDVRLVKMGNISMELCCGTHVNATGEIGAFFIKSHKSVAAGVKRIEAVCGMSAVQYILEKSQNNNKKSTKQVEDVKSNDVQIINQNNMKILVQKYENADQKFLLSKSDEYISNHDLVFLYNNFNGTLIRSNENVSIDLKKLLTQLNGRGGGKPNLVQGTIQNLNSETIIHQIKDALC